MGQFKLLQILECESSNRTDTLQAIYILNRAATSRGGQAQPGELLFPLCSALCILQCSGEKPFQACALRIWARIGIAGGNDMDDARGKAFLIGNDKACA
jgi:hypothetical protein